MKVSRVIGRIFFRVSSRGCRVFRVRFISLLYHFACILRRKAPKRHGPWERGYANCDYRASQESVLAGRRWNIEFPQQEFFLRMQDVAGARRILSLSLCVFELDLSCRETCRLDGALEYRC